tara:strand:+ start:1965 stop:3359 length:1395 start_codon:yes stop_codon:yes gene_type:complete
MSQLNADSCFIFTDTETTGLDINFSQIIQVGSVVTDESINELDKQDIGSKLLPWIVPSPEAYLVHKKIESLNSSSQSHLDMMSSLRQKWLNWSKGKNPVYITYNGHRFDEELFRRQFYWCLLPLYITNTSGAKRLDMLSTLQIVANFFKDTLKVPFGEDNEVSMKLTDWSSQNGIEIENAHDALADCYQMTGLAKLVSENARPAWKASLKGSSKNGNLEILQTEPFAMLGEVIRRRRFTYPVTFCGQNPKMQNEVAVADLYFDSDQLNDLSDSELLDQISNSGSAIRKLRINKSIPIIPVLDVPNYKDHLDVPFEQLEERAIKIKENVKLQQRVSELLASNQINYPPPKHLEQAVYSGFASEADELWMERFHAVTWNEKVNMVDGFQDRRYKELAERLICTNSPEDASQESLVRFNDFVIQRLTDKGPWNNLEKTKEKVEKLLIEAEGENRDILLNLKDYLKSI